MRFYSNAETKQKTRKSLLRDLENKTSYFPCHFSLFCFLSVHSSGGVAGWQSCARFAGRKRRRSAGEEKKRRRKKEREDPESSARGTVGDNQFSFPLLSLFAPFRSHQSLRVFWASVPFLLLLYFMTFCFVIIFSLGRSKGEAHAKSSSPCAESWSWHSKNKVRGRKEEK